MKNAGRQSSQQNCVADVCCGSLADIAVIRSPCILGDELRALRRLQREQDKSAYVFMLRHACGYALANRGHDTRAQKHSAHGARYTELSSTRFKNFWRE
jgi:hypothetical protein